MCSYSVHTEQCECDPSRVTNGRLWLLKGIGLTLSSPFSSFASAVGVMGCESPSSAKASRDIPSGRFALGPLPLGFASANPSDASRESPKMSLTSDMAAARRPYAAPLSAPLSPGRSRTIPSMRLPYAQQRFCFAVAPAVTPYRMASYKHITNASASVHL